jgi:hypothetical protein
MIQNKYSEEDKKHAYICFVITIIDLFFCFEVWSCMYICFVLKLGRVCTGCLKSNSLFKILYYSQITKNIVLIFFITLKHKLWNFVLDETNRLIVRLSKVKHEFRLENVSK